MGDREADQALVERVQAGDRQAFGLLVAKYQRRLLRLVSRLVRDPAEAEDVAQEAFIKAYRALPNFRGESAFYTWLYRIGVNTAKNWLAANGLRMPTNTEIESAISGCWSNTMVRTSGAKYERIGGAPNATKTPTMPLMPERTSV